MNKIRIHTLLKNRDINKVDSLFFLEKPYNYK
jgi:hypothetical protein